MKKLLSTSPSPFKRTLLHLGLLDVKRLPTYDKVELENHTSCKCPFLKKKTKEMSSGNDFLKWNRQTTSRNDLSPPLFPGLGDME